MTPVMSKLFGVTPPAAIVNNGSLTCNVIDTLGFRFCRVKVFLGATDIALTALKVQESDVKASATALTGGADVTGAVFGTSNNDTGVASTLPSATDDNKFFTVEIDLRGRKRYLLPVVTIGNGSTGAFAAVEAELYDGENVPTTAAQKGAAQNLKVPAL
jgi:hypothetical protein